MLNIEIMKMIIVFVSSYVRGLIRGHMNTFWRDSHLEKMDWYSNREYSDYQNCHILWFGPTIVAKIFNLLGDSAAILRSIFLIIPIQFIICNKRTTYPHQHVKELFTSTMLLCFFSLYKSLIELFFS